MHFKNKYLFFTVILLSALTLLAEPVKINAQTDPDLFIQSPAGLESCLQVLSSDTAPQSFPFNRHYGWKAVIRNTCSNTLIVQADFEWLDANGNSLGNDSDADIVIHPNATGIARSVKQLADDVSSQDLVESHFVTLHSVGTLENSVANCLSISSSAGRSTSGKRIGHYSWRANIENTCSVDLFTTIQFRLLTANGYPRISTANSPPLNKEDIFVPANGSTVAHNIFRYGRNAGYNISGHEFKLVENSIPQYSNVRVAIREWFRPDFVYNSTDSLLTIPLIDELGDAYEVTFLVVKASGQFYLVLDLSSIRSIVSPPAVAAQFLSDGRLTIQSVAAEDGSVVYSELVLELINPQFFVFELTSYAEPADSLSRFGYSLDSNSCIEIESVDSRPDLLNGINPPILRWTVEVSNGCAIDQEIQLDWDVMTEDGLILAPNVGASSRTVLVPSQSIEIFTGYILTAASTRVSGEFASDLVRIKY